MQRSNTPAQERADAEDESHQTTTLRTFLSTTAVATFQLLAFTGDGSENAEEDVYELPDLSDDYPNTRFKKAGTGHAFAGLWFPEQWNSYTRAETEDFGGTSGLDFYQHALQWEMGISLKITAA